MRRLFALTLFFSHFLSLAWAENNDMQPYRERIENQSQALAKMPPSTPNPGCQKRYDRLWRDGVLKFDWFYGHIDADNVAVDRLVQQETMRALLLPCRPGFARGACGFKIIQDDSKKDGPLTLSKTLPGGRRFEIRTWQSSLNDLQSQNVLGQGRLTWTWDAQTEKSDRIQAAYLDSVRNSEVVVYDGHSRYGSGPGFRPYGLGEIVKSTLTKATWNNLLYALHQSPKKPELLMFASCQSQRYYLSEIERRSRQTAIAATEGTESLGTNEQMVFSLVDSLAEGRCEDQINLALQPAQGRDGGMKVFHFDAPAPPPAPRPEPRTHEGAR